MVSGRRIGSKVKLTPFGKKLYPQFAGKVGKVIKRDILTKGHGIASGLQGSYRVAYWIRWTGEKRNYLMSSGWLTKA